MQTDITLCTLGMNINPDYELPTDHSYICDTAIFYNTILLVDYIFLQVV